MLVRVDADVDQCDRVRRSQDMDCHWMKMLIEDAPRMLLVLSDAGGEEKPRHQRGQVLRLLPALPVTVHWDVERIEYLFTFREINNL